MWAWKVNPRSLRMSNIILWTAHDNAETVNEVYNYKLKFSFMQKSNLICKMLCYITAFVSKIIHTDISSDDHELSPDLRAESMETRSPPKVNSYSLLAEKPSLHWFYFQLMTSANELLETLGWNSNDILCSQGQHSKTSKHISQPNSFRQTLSKANPSFNRSPILY